MKLLHTFSALLLVSAVFLSGCLSVTSAPHAPGEGSEYNDAGIKTTIASTLLKADATKANTVNVHVIEGHVFLVGEADTEFRRLAVSTARGTTGVVHVTTHWFPEEAADPVRDSSLHVRLEQALSPLKKTPGVSMLDVDVWGGHAVLTGTVRDKATLDRAVQIARQQPGIVQVTSYLSLARR